MKYVIKNFNYKTKYDFSYWTEVSFAFIKNMKWMKRNKRKKDEILMYILNEGCCTEWRTPERYSICVKLNGVVNDILTVLAYLPSFAGKLIPQKKKEKKKKKKKRKVMKS